MNKLYRYLIAAIFAITFIGAGTATSVTAEGDNTNSEQYWEDQTEHPSTCYKHGATGVNDHGGVYTDGNGKTYVKLKTFNPAWIEGGHWELLVVKGGGVDGGNAVYHHPSAGVSYYAPLNSGGQQANVSHWIVCKGKPPYVPPTTTTTIPVTTTTVPVTTTTIPVTTTTVPITTTTTVPETTTTVPVTTTIPETTTTVTVPETTVPETTTTAVPVPEVTTTTILPPPTVEVPPPPTPAPAQIVPVDELPATGASGTLIIFAAILLVVGVILAYFRKK